MGMILVRNITHLATKIFGSTLFNHIPAECLSRVNESIMDTLVVLFVLLLELMGDVVFFVSSLIPISVAMRSSFLDDVLQN